MITKSNPKSLFWNNFNTETLLLKSLDSEGVSVTSTDTVLGLLAKTTQKGLKQLNTIKYCKFKRQFLILISDAKKLSTFIQIEYLTKIVQSIIDNCWPGPLTIIFKGKKGLPSFLAGKNNTVAIRFPTHKGLQQLLSHFDGLFSSSANLEGEDPPHNVYELSTEIIEKVDYIVIDKDIVKAKTAPSTIIDVSSIKPTGEGSVKVIRAGAFPIEILKGYCGTNFDNQ
jgi:L-threonylcarbamoyladenylate synthase